MSTQTMTDFESKLRALMEDAIGYDGIDRDYPRIIGSKQNIMDLLRAAAALAFEEAATLCDDVFGNCVDTLENGVAALQCAKSIRALSQTATGVKR